MQENSQIECMLLNIHREYTERGWENELDYDCKKDDIKGTVEATIARGYEVYNEAADQRLKDSINIRYIEADPRGQGFGAAVLSIMENRLKNEGARYVSLQPHNLRLAEYYKSLGYQCIGRYCGNMVKEL